MACNTSNRALLAAAARLGKVDWQDDVPEIANHLAEVQTNFVVRRTRLRPDVARLVAELAFGRAAA